MIVAFIINTKDVSNLHILIMQIIIPKSLKTVDTKILNDPYFHFIFLTFSNCIRGNYFSTGISLVYHPNSFHYHSTHCNTTRGLDIFCVYLTFPFTGRKLNICPHTLEFTRFDTEFKNIFSNQACTSYVFYDMHFFKMETEGVTRNIIL